jgi:hypothetical protein
MLRAERAPSRPLTRSRRGENEIDPHRLRAYRNHRHGTCPRRNMPRLRTKLNRLEKVLDLENSWLNPARPQAEEFGSQQERRDIAGAKLSVRQYVQTADTFLAQCPDPGGYIAHLADIWEHLEY